MQMEQLVSLCKRRGFLFQSSEIYGGLNGFWDYGPLGTELKQNLKARWWQRVVRERPDIEGIDSSIIAHPRHCRSTPMDTGWHTWIPNLKKSPMCRSAPRQQVSL